MDNEEYDESKLGKLEIIHKLELLRLHGHQVIGYDPMTMSYEQLVAAYRVVMEGVHDIEAYNRERAMLSLRLFVAETRRLFPTGAALKLLQSDATNKEMKDFLLKYTKDQPPE